MPSVLRVRSKKYLLSIALTVFVGCSTESFESKNWIETAFNPTIGDLAKTCRHGFAKFNSGSKNNPPLQSVLGEIAVTTFVSSSNYEGYRLRDTNLVKEDKDLQNHCMAIAFEAMTQRIRLPWLVIGEKLFSKYDFSALKPKMILFDRENHVVFEYNLYYQKDDYGTLRFFADGQTTITDDVDFDSVSKAFLYLYSKASKVPEKLELNKSVISGLL